MNSGHWALRAEGGALSRAGEEERRQGLVVTQNGPRRPGRQRATIGAKRL